MKAAIGAVTEDVQRLIDALDARDIFSIELANIALVRSLDQLRAIGAWRECREDLEQIDHAIALAEAARVRVNLLSDMTRRKMELVEAARSGETLVQTYGRAGRSAKVRA